MVTRRQSRCPGRLPNNGHAADTEALTRDLGAGKGWIRELLTGLLEL